ncbi:uncharacterized protein PGRI_053030 [Penicillium griseofulvum]|uniref:Uncharacterized protein n=1 Tax=Penicillium patulum TaxID=5078 RepID=A0A135LBT8_PENPA|nr:uncharacterized protein PGRI_053030 [Penicillium griseofulvum]KXG46447.1 hypothetical protein PGRI_053030 [Penicillium griseofulvum]
MKLLHLGVPWIPPSRRRLRNRKNFRESDKPFADFARKVDHQSTTRIWLPNDTKHGERVRSERSPDASFKHEQAKYPGVIIEVCYAQKVQAATDLADDYILDTDGNVKAVIALNIESKKATISIWRPEYVTLNGVEELQPIAKVEALPFRTESGLPVEEPAKGPAFRLSLRDFAPTSISQENTDVDHYISISLKELYIFLSYAEAQHQQQLLDEGIVDPFPPGKRKRRRLRTPELV